MNRVHRDDTENDPPDSQPAASSADVSCTGINAKLRDSQGSYVRDIVLVVAIAAFIRVVIAFLSRGYEVDLQYFRDWGQSLRIYGIANFYSNTGSADHLPGDLYVHALIACVSGWVGVSTEGRTYDLIMKLLPSLLDIVLIIMVAWMLRRLVSRATLLTLVAFIAVNPALILAGAVWGQWDIYSILLLVVMAATCFRYPGQWMFTAPIAALVVCTKPNLVLPMIPLVVAMLIRKPFGADSLMARFREGVIFLSLSFVLMVLILVPFQVSLPFLPGEIAYLNLVNYAIDKFQFTTLGASNIWSIPIQGYEWKTDLEVTRLGVTSRDIGNLLLAAAVTFAIASQIIWSWKSRTLAPVIWSMTMVSMAMFMLPTRAHERYMLPAAILAIILVGFISRKRTLPRTVALVTAGAMSIALALNLYAIYSWATLTSDELRWLWVLSTILNVASFLVLAALPFLVWWTNNRRGRASQY